MAEFCLKCLQKFEPNANEDNTTLSEYLDWCEGCAELRQVVVTFDDGSDIKETIKVKPRKVETTFCEKCDKDVKFKIDWQGVASTTPKGIITYKELYAYCPHCQDLLYVPAINDINVYRREKAYRELPDANSPEVQKGIENLKEMFKNKEK